MAMSLSQLANIADALREVFGELCKVSRQQNAEIGRRGGVPYDDVPELQHQASVLLGQLDDVARQAELVAFFDDNESDSGASSSFDSRRATIQKWTQFVGGTREKPDFSLGVDEDVFDSDEEDVGDSASMVGPVEHEEANTSIHSVNASFWKSDGFNWADEASCIDEETEEEEGQNSQDSHSNFLVPELDEDSGHMDTASDSGLSFRSEDMNGQSSVVGSQRASELEQETPTVEPVVVTDANRQFLRDRTVSFNFKLLADYDADTDTESTDANASPRKPSTSTFPRRLFHGAHLRRPRVDSLPQMRRLVALKE